jgi:Xaa-Pro dipeptidase
LKELEIKTERLVAMLNAEKLGGVLINSRHNFAWLSGGKNNGIDISREQGSCFLFVRKDGKRFLLANKIEMPRLLAEEVSADDFQPLEFAWEADKIDPAFVSNLAGSLLNDNSKIAADLPLSNLRVVENLIARCRFSLTPQEIRRFRLLGKDAGEIVEQFISTIEPNESEIEIARKIRYELSKFNINSVVTLVAADERIKQFRHPIPTKNTWKKTLLIVVCAKRNGLIASLSRIISNGKISADLRNRTNANARIYAKMLAATTVGTSGAEIFKAAKSAYATENFADEINKHHQGGACGYRTRDWVAHSNSTEQVQVNQAFAWNPTITGTKIEETVLIKNDGIEVLTASPNFPTISVEINGINYSSPDILVL